MLLLLLPVLAMASDYRAEVDRIATQRAELAERWQAATPAERPTILAEARRVVDRAIVDTLMPAWEGTTWAFHGMTTTPREGEIACGFYVTTLLRDAGFQVERDRLARQASENIIRTVSPKKTMWRRIGVSAEASVDGAEDGLYIAGLDQHTGFVVVRAGAARFCDASYVSPAAVTCQPVATSASFSSNYRVFGSVLADETLVKWLEGRAFPTVGNVTR